MIKKEKEWTLVIDAYYLCYKAFYTMPKNFSFDDRDTNIIYGFLNQIKKLVQDFKTNKLVFCFDSSKSYRRLEYPGYKIRDENKTSQEKENIRMAKLQFAELEEEILPAMGFKNIYSQPGYEADDLMAELCYRFPDDYIIVTGDEDLFQLLSAGPVRETRLYMKGKKMMTEMDFEKAFGIKPYQWKMVKAIAGCPTDAVEGVEGVGNTKAIHYIRGDLSEGKIKERIKNSNDIIQRNLRLVALPYLGVKPININEYPAQDVLYTIDFMEVFNKYGFGSFIDKLDEWRQLFDLKAGNRV